MTKKLKLMRDEGNQRILTLGKFTFAPMGGGYWAINEDGELRRAWAVAEEVRAFIKAI